MQQVRLSFACVCLIERKFARKQKRQCTMLCNLVVVVVDVVVVVIDRVIVVVVVIVGWCFLFFVSDCCF